MTRERTPWEEQFFRSAGFYPPRNEAQPGEPPAGVADPPPAEPAAADSPPAEPPAPNPGPWDAALAQRFEDANQRQAMEQFLREEVQPYVTRREQELATQRNEAAERLWNDFHENGEETLLNVARELYRDEPGKAEAVVAALKGDADPSKPPPDPEDFIQPDELDPSTRELLDWATERRRQEAWDTMIEEVTADLEKTDPDIKLDEDLFQPFVLAANGDVNVALDQYKGYVAKFREKFGEDPPPPEGESADPPASPAPPTIGNTHGTQPDNAPPAPGNLDDAIAETVAMMRQAENPPPTV